jgi:alpha/beta superfamily hydrolase
MQVPPELKPALWGALGGAAALWIIGFSWGGWTTAATAASQAKTQSDKAVVTALAPFCVARFKAQTDAPASLAALKKVSSWQQGSFIEKGGWATSVSGGTADPAVASACAEMLVAGT